MRKLKPLCVCQHKKGIINTNISVKSQKKAAVFVLLHQNLHHKSYDDNWDNTHNDLRCRQNKKEEKQFIHSSTRQNLHHNSHTVQKFQFIKPIEITKSIFLDHTFLSQSMTMTL